MKRLVVLVGAVVLTFLTGPASAEWLVDLYGGGAFTQKSDLSITGDLPGVSGKVTLPDTEFDKSFVVGLRGGYWFGEPSFEGLSIFGVAFDVWHFRPNANSASADVNGVNVSTNDLTVQVTTLSVDLISGPLPGQPGVSEGPTAAVRSRRPGRLPDPRGRRRDQRGSRAAGGSQ